MHSWPYKASLLLIVWTAYGIAFLALQPHLGVTTNDLSLLAVAATAWFGGLPLGVLTGLLAAPATLLLANALEPTTASVLPLDAALASATLTNLVFGTLVGLARTWRGRAANLKRVSYDAQHDALTGLLNRSTLESRVERLLKIESDDALTALLFVDLDRFKFVNDTFGHHIGDELLKAVARVLQANVRQNDLIGRVGGDEFIIVLQGLKEPQSAAHIAAKLVRQLGSPFTVKGKTVCIGASIGIAIAPDDGTDIHTLTKSADNAMYKVKESGKNWFAFSTQEMRANEDRRLTLEHHLRNALQNDELALAYQPIVDIATSHVAGVEALVRWNNALLGGVSPSEFIPLAEDVGLILPINRWVLREACRQNTVWRNAGYPPLRISVNISAQLFLQPSFPKEVQSVLEQNRLPSELLEIEITETVLMNDMEGAVRTLRALDAIGVGTSLDDFGTGYSSLAYLQQLPIRRIKLDQTFISGLAGSALRTSSGNSAMITEAICALAQKLQKPVVAEGVETTYQRDFLKNIACEYAQGYLYAKPMPPHELERILQRSQPSLTKRSVAGAAA